MQNDNEESIDSTNDEELVDNEANDEFTGTAEEESSEEPEIENSSDADGDDGNDERTARAKAQRERLAEEIKQLKAEKAKLKEGSKENNSKESQLATNSELVERTYLAANGIKDKDVQNEVMRLAKKFDISVDQALDDTDINQRANALIKKKQAAQAVAKSTGGTATGKKTPSYYADYFKKNGDFPSGTSSDMIAKATDILAKS